MIFLVLSHGPGVTILKLAQAHHRHDETLPLVDGWYRALPSQVGQASK